MGNRISVSPVAIVIGRGGYNEMGLIRSCGEAGMDVLLIAPDNMIIPIYRSKYVKKWYSIDIHDSDSLTSTIETIKKDYPDRIMALYPATDLASALIDKNYVLLSGMAVIPHASGRLEILMDKSVMSKIAINADLKVPVTKKFNLGDSEKLDVSYPCIIKPYRSISGEKGDINICRDRESLESAVSIYKSKGFFNVIVQDLIEGKNQEEIAVTGVSAYDGNVYTYGVIHKIRIRDNGSTVFASYRDDLPHMLHEKIVTFISKTGYKGIFDIEFLSNENGIYFIECNFRNGAYGYAVTRAGFNMPRIFMETSQNIPVKPVSIRKTVFMEERSDMLHMLEHSISPSRWFRDFIKTNVYLWWNWKDPRPMMRVPYFIKRLYN
ncbi:MAG: ATP-grasp domain-containing protein [Muribaculaceae bacterium]|nr:ATP-grasp domain-containing protein [Muribaculaceae bacterium]